MQVYTKGFSIREFFVETSSASAFEKAVMAHQLSLVPSIDNLLAHRKHPLEIAPIDADGLRYMACNTDVQAFRIDTGDLAWQVPVTRSSGELSIQPWTPTILIKAVALRNGELSVTDETGKIHEMDAKTGAVRQQGLKKFYIVPTVVSTIFFAAIYRRRRRWDLVR